MSSLSKNGHLLLVGVGASLAAGACLAALLRYYTQSMDAKLSALHLTISRLNQEINQLSVKLKELVGKHFSGFCLYVPADKTTNI